jgi:hypothetical protein
MIEGTLLGLVYIIAVGFGFFLLLAIGYGILRLCRNDSNDSYYQEILSSDV